MAREEGDWTIGSLEEFLDLSEAEVRFIDLKIALGDAVREVRKAKRMSQTKLAARLETSQAQVARMERGRTSVDGMLQALIALGETGQEIGAVLARFDDATKPTRRRKGPAAGGRRKKRRPQTGEKKRA